MATEENVEGVEAKRPVLPKQGFEPDVMHLAGYGNYIGAAQISGAISLKRIADSLQVIVGKLNEPLEGEMD